MIGAFVIGCSALACFGIFALRESGLTAVIFEDVEPVVSGVERDLTPDELARLHFVHWLREHRARTRDEVKSGEAGRV
jgi:hypothetical protein